MRKGKVMRNVIRTNTICASFSNSLNRAIVTVSEVARGLDLALLLKREAKAAAKTAAAQFMRGGVGAAIGMLGRYRQMQPVVSVVRPTWHTTQPVSWHPSV
ncbi:MAG: hypothetical protein K1X74_15870 [Pirellulales bacterium]|nr:hypothetical protein [Pirellulales bacterium]